jgi:hypothetical protein
MEARLWAGSDRKLRVLVNGYRTRTGAYETQARFAGAKNPDQIASPLFLQEGWNELELDLECGDDPGFGARVCSLDNTEIPGLRWEAEQPKDPAQPTPDPYPKSGGTFDWDAVCDDWSRKLPRLKTGVAGVPDFEGRLLVTPGPVTKADPANRRLDNLLNWERGERVAAFPREQGALLFVRVEAMEAYTRLLAVEAKPRLLGYVVSGDRVFFVIETDLRSLPEYEQDLLDPAKAR